MKKILCTLATGLCLSTAALAQPPATDWPTKPVRWVVPFPPGGAMDAIARTLGDKASKALGQPFVIENRAGAGGNIGTDAVAKAKPDGHTILITSIGMATNKPLYGKLTYDPAKDFAPVSLLAVVPNVLVTNATQPNVKTVADVVAAARKAPGQLTYASAGNGTSIHLAGEMFTSLTSTDMLHIPYRGSGPAVADLLGGQVNYMFDSITSARPHLQSGKLRALAVTTAKRSSALPNVPTLAEAGVAGYEVSPWFAVFAPAGTPQAVVDKLQRTLTDAMQQPDVIARFETIGAEPVGSSPDELATHLQRESVRWSKLIAERGIKLD
ncbi:MAG: tripartite tricarboxylate transporter substrate binding protein [Hydrogenophaga sp.]|jgi:tripartite-type tricarboxylate transporter receptor subunit TctC|nr:tripartite tricarboxylate transporter substrate binding protein [Hydrogenophaga sp.]